MVAAKRLSDDGLSTPVTVNGVEVAARAINIESGNYDGGTIEQRQQQATISLVIRELLRQRADNLQLEAGDEEARLDAVIDRDVTFPQADDASCRGYYDKNKSRFYSEPLVEARHILLPAPPDDLDALEQQRAIAEDLVAQLQKDRGAFGRLAKRYSACPSAEDGGNLGQLTRGQTVREFEDKALTLPEGLAERPIETRYGWHVLEIVHRVDGVALPFDTVKQQIGEYLTECAQRRAYIQYIRLLAAEANIKGVELDAADSPLVQ